MDKFSSLFIILSITSIVIGFSIFRYQEDTKALNIPIQSEDRDRVVYISGAITNPGVYQIESQIILGELIEQAGGTHISADLQYLHKNLNLAERLDDGEHIYIRFRGEGQSFSSTTVSGDQGVDINSASAELLQTLEGVGPATAKKIIEGRPYQKIEELLNVSGIGQKSFDRWKNSIFVGNSNV
jgi:competence protein ComEA